MSRESLLREILPLARLANWSACDLGHLTGRWGKLATLEQLTACRDRLFDLTAHGHDILPEAMDHVTPACPLAVARDDAPIGGQSIGTIPGRTVHRDAGQRALTPNQLRAAQTAAAFGFTRGCERVAEWKQAEQDKARRRTFKRLGWSLVRAIRRAVA